MCLEDTRALRTRRLARYVFRRSLHAHGHQFASSDSRSRMPTLPWPSKSGGPPESRYRGQWLSRRGAGGSNGNLVCNSAENDAGTSVMRHCRRSRSPVLTGGSARSPRKNPGRMRSGGGGFSRAEGGSSSPTGSKCRTGCRRRPSTTRPAASPGRTHPRIRREYHPAPRYRRWRDSPACSSRRAGWAGSDR